MKIGEGTFFIKRFAVLLVLIFSSSLLANDGPRETQIPVDKHYSERMALTIMQQSPEAWKMMHYKLLASPKWDYTYGFVLLSMQKLYLKTGDKRYLEYGKQYVDQFVDASGNISKYNIEDFSLDHLNNGKLLFLLYKEYQDERYAKALHVLRKHLEWQPRTKGGGFWHKKIYPYQIWLDGFYMGHTFWAMYANEFAESSEVFADIAQQFMLIEQHTRDEKTGLLLHAWDESRIQQWADKETGRSAHVWSRALGWYLMALVDTLEVFPKDHANYNDLVAILDRLSDAIAPYQHTTGLWYQVTDKGERYGNYLETSGTAMFSYALAKGVRLGYLPKQHLQVAEKAFAGIVKSYIEIDPANNELYLTYTVGGTGLGNSPYRTGDFEYYVGEAVRKNDPHGLGAFILASIELGK